MSFADSLHALRPDLLRYARYQLGDDTTAEDVVQETLLAALEKPESFSGQSTLRTWVTAILKFKVIDAQRRRYKDPLHIHPQLDEENDLSDFDTLFDKTGHWGSEGPRHWSHPDASLQDKQFWTTFEACRKTMPARTALVFCLREITGLEIEAICQQLEITATNCSVLLYRARMALRMCLQKNWFDDEVAG